MKSWIAASALLLLCGAQSQAGDYSIYQTFSGGCGLGVRHGPYDNCAPLPPASHRRTYARGYRHGYADGYDDGFHDGRYGDVPVGNYGVYYRPYVPIWGSGRCGLGYRTTCGLGVCWASCY